MKEDEYLKYWRNQLDAGKRINQVRVRRLLEIFGAARRGIAIVAHIKEKFKAYGLETDPDFETHWIDGLVRVQFICARSTGEANALDETSDDQPSPIEASVPLDPPENESQSEQATQETPEEDELIAPVVSPGVIQTVTEEPSDPTLRISNFSAAHNAVSFVRFDDPIETATTCMMLHGYSQMPIMQDDRQVRGMISWESIALQYSLGVTPTKVGDCRADAQVIDERGSFFEAIPTIEKHGYVLVRAKDRRITGIITTSDLSAEFRLRSGPFIRIRDIELHLRQIVLSAMTDYDFDVLQETSRARGQKDRALLTFGEYASVLHKVTVWERANLKIDRTEFFKRIEEVRRLRNEVMHFGRDYLTPDELAGLEKMAEFLRNLFQIRHS
jgi:predicted transcriptional regulator